MAANVQLSAGSNLQLTVAGGNLFSIAAAEYGDPSAWTTLAQANGLSDPFVVGIDTLTVPPTPGTTGGILPV